MYETPQYHQSAYMAIDKLWLIHRSSSTQQSRLHKPIIKQFHRHLTNCSKCNIRIPPKWSYSIMASTCTCIEPLQSSFHINICSIRDPFIVISTLICAAYEAFQLNSPMTMHCSPSCFEFVIIIDSNFSFSFTEPYLLRIRKEK